MKMSVFASVILLLCLVLMPNNSALSQAGTPLYSWGEGYHYHTFDRDSCSATDSNLVMYTPAHLEYYRGFYVLTSSNTGTPTYRFCPRGSEVTAADSTVLATYGIPRIWISQKAYPRVALAPGTVYRIQYINAGNTPTLRSVVVLVTSDR